MSQILLLVFCILQFFDIIVKIVVFIKKVIKMFHKEFSQNNYGVDYIVGDIHGNYEELMIALDSISFDKKKDRLFCAGDIADRGSNDLLTTFLVFEPWFFSVMGNHEQMLITRNFYAKEQNGTAWAYDILVSEGKHEEKDTLNKYLEQIKTLPLAITVKSNGKKFGIVHAESDETWFDTVNQAEAVGRFMAKSNEFIEFPLLWDRTITIKEYKNFIIENHITGVDYCFHGHTIMHTDKTVTPKVFGNRVYLDTGFFFGNKTGVGVISIFDTKNEIMNVISIDFKSKKPVDVISNPLSFYQQSLK
jgi:serine/threonine protein phosphatase 1